MQDNIISENALSAMKDFLIDLRRDLHAHPELGFQEFRTSEKISSILDSLNIKYKNKVAETGIIADIEGEDKDFTIAFRADMDALPMEDKKNCSYSSQNKGKCHSCGHDVHTTVLTGIAKYFSEIKPPCNIRLIYQPAEETTGGALPMIKEHALDNVNVIYGLHVRPEINVGQVSVTYGAMYASSNMFEVHIHGKSAHGAKSYNGIDAIVIAAHIITQLHSFTSVFTDGSMRLHIGTINGGSANNVVADNVKMEGIIRMLCDDDTRNKRLNMIENIIKNTAKSFNADADFINIPSYPALINHDDAVNIVKTSAESVLGKENCLLEKSNMTAEDFSYYVQRIKGAFFSLGVSNEKINVPIHNSLFDIDENAINIGVKMQVLNVYNTYKNKDRFIN